MASELVEIEVLVLVDEDGNWEVAHDADVLKERYEESVGELNAGTATRLVKVKLKVPVPRPVELEAEVCEEVSGGELKAV